MSLSTLITSGPVPRPQRVTVYGQNGVGKSTLAKDFPASVFLDCEDGTSHMDVPRIAIENTTQLFAAIRTLGEESHDYKSVVIDTVDAVEKMLRQRVCSLKGIKSIEDLCYGRGWTALREEFMSFLHLLDDWLIRKGINVVIIGHSQVKKVQPPGLADSYDRWELKLDPHNSAALKEWSDCVLFMHYDTKVVESASGKMRGVGGTDRVIHATHNAAWDAKNRVGLSEKLPAEFSELAPLFSPVSDPVVQLTEALSDMDADLVHGYLASIKWSTDGVAGMSQKHARAALQRLPAMRDAINEFRQGVSYESQPATTVEVKS
jgi:hypothetical protein